MLKMTVRTARAHILVCKLEPGEKAKLRVLVF